MPSFISGFLLGFSLILAIGAQNAFLLRQGLRREHVFVLCLICAVSDALLIAAGVAGIGAITQLLPWLEPVMRFGGAAFLLAYGALSLLRAWRGGAALRGADARQGTSLVAAVATVLALTWLNPHVYLDTVLLVGSLSAQTDNRIAFGAGAVTASFTFFFGLGYGAGVLAPVFEKPSAWRLLDLGIGLTMWGIAVGLIAM